MIKGRKFYLALISFALILFVTLAAVWLEPLQSLLTSFLSGIISIFSIYCTGNIVNKHVVGKTIEVQQLDSDPKKKPSTKEEDESIGD